MAKRRIEARGRPLPFCHQRPTLRGMTRTLLSIGHGYSAQALAKVLLAQGGWRIIGTTRSAEKAARLKADGIEALVWPGEDLTGALPQATHVLSSVSPDADGDAVLRALSPALAAEASRLDWVAYLSTTGVYGDHAGGWVDEDTPLAPSTRRGRWRKQAEAGWKGIPDLPLHIFRLAGIYGPGRGPFSKVRAGTARRIIKPGQVFSRIHVEDIAQTLAASIAKPRPGRIYNLCDDDPAPPQDVIAHAAGLLGMEVPKPIPFEDAELSPMARSFYAESKRVRNDRIKTELGVRLRYPDYRSGLAALLKAEVQGR
ncbi:Nucleoside-diphosphate-sugar epimerase [Primorskyibacter flagellatus]|uniref:Nucleoside-diphosphate-sugar epimerase n=2 Tax=Primorskyibacter flagellatus TaxID=1387277 RepID=A0A1W2AP82_9RHOB|nr:Nucleoside-diphosphate-sugar epimerase [Primorskyibacter flagellatus]